MRSRPAAGPKYSAVERDDDLEAGGGDDDDDGAKQPRGGWVATLRGLPLRLRALGLLLGCCFVEQVLEQAFGTELTGPSRLLRLLLLPVRAAGYVEYLLVLVAPLVLSIALCAWRWLAAVLPDADGAAGQAVVRALRRSALGSLALVAALALDGDPLVRAAFVVYVLGAVVWAVRMACVDKALRRTLRTWALFLPLITHYNALAAWVKYAKVPKHRSRRAYERLHVRYAPRVYRLMVELGGLYVKAGQLLSLLPAGVLPAAYTREFKKMQSDCPARPSEEVQAQVAEALGRPIAELFSSFCERPLGTASISQVHRARLARDGRDVVVKVQFPEVAASLEADFGSIALIVRLLDSSKCEELREAKRHFEDELDFVAEAETLERVHANLKKPFPTVRVPEPVRELCTPTVLVMTFVPGTSFLDGIMRMAEAVCQAMGTSVDDVAAGVAKFAAAEPKAEPKALEAAPAAAAGPTKLQAEAEPKPQVEWAARLAAQRVNPVRVLQTCMRTSRAAVNMGVAAYNFSVGRLGACPLEYRQSIPNFDPVQLSRTIWQVHGHQLLLDGLFNSDPHPGNILIEDQRLGLIDFGQICELGLATRVRFARLLLALAEGDDHEIAKRHAQLGFQTRRMSTETVALSARLRFGAITDDFMPKLGRIRELEKADPVLRQRHDDKFVMAERLITILRGTAFVCGVGMAHCATSLWLDMARELLQAHGATSAAEDASTEGVELDLEPDSREGEPVVAEEWKFDLVPLENIGEEEFFEVDEGDNAGH